MKDYFGNQVNEGDTVAMIAPQYRHFAMGKVIKVTAKRAQIEFSNEKYRGNTERIYQSSEQIIKRLKDK